MDPLSFTEKSIGLETKSEQTFLSVMLNKAIIR